MPQAEEPHSTTPSRRRFLVSAPVIIAGIAGQGALPADANNANEDGELIELGRQLALINMCERHYLSLSADGDETQDTACRAANDQGHAVVNRILRLQATTIKGLDVKAHAALWMIGAFDGIEQAREHAMLEEPTVLSLIFDIVIAAEKLRKAVLA